MITLEHHGELGELPCLLRIDERVPSHLQLLEKVVDEDRRDILPVALILVVVEHVLLPPHLVTSGVVGKEVHIPLLAPV